ncbi:MAG: hypothetical protein WBS22_10715, partial [Methylocystis sp.]
NQIALGTAATSYRAPGLGVGGASTAAQVGSTNFVTADANGTLGVSPFGPGSIANLNNSVNILGANVAALNQQVFANQREARQGIAIAYAGVTAPMPSAPGRTTWIVNAGVYKNESAIAGSIAHRLDLPIPLALVAGVSVGTRNSVAAKGGLQGEF